MLEEHRQTECILDYSLHYFSLEKEIDFNQYPEILQNIKDTTVIIINQFPKPKSCTSTGTEDKHLIICFHKTLIIFKQPIVSFIINPILGINDKIRFCFLNNTKIFFDEIKYNEISKNDFFDNKLIIDSFNVFFKKQLHKNSKQFFTERISFSEFCDIICPCLTAYSINVGYRNLNTNRIQAFYNNKDINKDKSTCERTINEDDYIELRTIGRGYASIAYLIYHIKDKKFYVIKKKSNINDKEFEKLRNRELYNYKKINNHPCLPKFYGITNKNHYFVIEYINGQTLENADFNNFSETDIFSIIIHILSVIKYFHDNDFIYRDLNPSNIMIDSNKTAVIIDFDQMKKSNEEKNPTSDFDWDFVAPEIKSTGKFTKKSDSYSIGKIINYIINKYNNTNQVIEYTEINELINKCCNDKPDERPTILDIIGCFYSICHSKNIILNNVDRNDLFELGECYRQAQDNLGVIYHDGKYITRNISIAIYYYSLAANQNYPQAQFNLGMIYSEGKYIKQDINKAIHLYSLSADQNYPEAQYNLGAIYYQGKYITRDINKAIHYLTLAANQNDPKAQLSLGTIYYKSEYITRDIKKAIYYLTLAANQNDPEAQNNLGNIYYKGEYIARDINKAIYYLTLAANQNDQQAQFNLGYIYYKGGYITRDINKAIHYYSLAANQNDPEAQFNLGVIYHDDKYITRDINKAIHYFTLAANQNFPKAQFNLGIIYSEGKYITRDIKKAIHYYSLAANQNYPEAQLNLGNIYYEGKYITRDINKAIYYYSLAANQNFPQAQHNLENIYYNGKYITRDINKVIYYLTFAAKQNDPQAQNNLGAIYYEGKYITRDINKAIYYFTLAANQNFPQAQTNLGAIYYEGKYITQDINKAIHYFSLAANQNYPQAQFNLGAIYSKSKYIKRDIKKAIYYFTLAANQNYPEAQYNLGNIYNKGEYIARDINKAIYYLTLAAKQNDQQAQFNLGVIYYLIGTQKNINLGIYWILESAEKGSINACFFIGFVYHEGKHVNQDIKKSIHYYKEASSFNNQYAKNNLGIIYKHGIDNEIEKNAANAEIYFSESINQKNDRVSMYNLAHLYIYEEGTAESIDKSINLLINSSNLEFSPSAYLLLIVLFKKYDRNIEKIKKDFSKINKIVLDHLFSKNEFEFIISLYNDEECLEKNYQYYKNIDYLYGQLYKVIETNHLYDFINQKQQIVKQGNDINHDFYDGLNCDI